MNCLIQLSSLMGPVLTDSESVNTQKLSASNTSNFVTAHDRYVSNFIAGFVDIFGRYFFTKVKFAALFFLNIIFAECKASKYA